jgi:hypothetical protein
LKVYNLLGQEVATLYEGIRRQRNYEAMFDGSKLASGVYFYRLCKNNPSQDSGEVFMDTNKLVFIK